MLWATASEMGYASPYWMTYKQAEELKAHVKKGEKGSLVVYADKIITIELKPEGETETHHIPFIKGYSVFNASQTEGLSETYYHTPEIKMPNPEARREQLETLLRYFIHVA